MCLRLPVSAEQPDLRRFRDYARRIASRTERRVSARSPGPCPSLSVTLAIGITSKADLRSSPSDMLELTHDMRQIRTFG